MVVGSRLAGIADEAQRQSLLGLARRFAELGDQALHFEGERPAPSSPGYRQ